ncbi:MAG: ribonuclease III [Proteobacteria bacterium]|nr:ribonuclease III [Pseudomonadota bacterium]
MESDPIEKLEQHLGHHFRDRELLLESLTHTSYASEHATRHNERLEFLGDSIINAITTVLLMEHFPESDEGDLSWLRTRLVDTSSLAEIGLEIGLSECLRLGRGEAGSGGHLRESNMADTTEAVVGALFLELGFEGIKGLVAQWMNPRIDSLDTVEQSQTGWKNPRNQLQELIEHHEKTTIKYAIVDRTGPDHNPVFFAEVYVGDRTLGKGSGSNKRVAYRAAAEDALQRLETP